MASDGIRYFAGIGEEWCEIEIQDDGVSVDGETIAADISTLPGSDRQHMRLDGRSLSMFARRGSDGWTIELEGRLFVVQVEDERSRHIRELASQVLPTKIGRELRAPMPGMIVRVEVEEGQEIDAGDGLLVMEAMKMENELKAEAAGIVTSIEVRAGQAVERDTVLMRLEAR
jgi:pyruvate carboxylase subunit B